MKKIFLLLVTLLLCFPAITACAATENDNLSIVLQIDNQMMTVNGVAKEIDSGRNTVPVVVNERTLLPARAVVEEMGGSVSWDEASQTSTFTYGTDKIDLTVGSRVAYFNGTARTIDVAPTVINDRTMLPIRFIGESFQFKVDWQEDEERIIISKGGEPVDNIIATQPNDTSASKAVVIYFSATGNTRVFAEKIGAAAGAEVYEIIPQTAYTAEDLNYNNANSRANREINTDARPEIKSLSIELSQYDTIFLGYPIWHGQCPPAVRTFLANQDLAGKTIMPFCTSGSTGISGSLAKIKELAPNSVVTDGFRGTGRTTEQQIKGWLEENNFLTE